MPIIVPEPLKKGDTIAIIAPARSIEIHETNAFKLWANQCGRTVVDAPNLYGKFHQFSGTIEQRVNDIHWAFSNSEVKAIFCARGGYGSAQLIDFISKDIVISNPKWLVGFSDITTLHLWLNQRGICSIHGPMVAQFNLNHNYQESNQRYLFECLTGKTSKIGCRQLQSHNLRPFSGMLTGGNLSLIFANAASSNALNNHGKVVFIEDLDEYLYHVDRMICSLKTRGYFEGIEALIVGSMIDMNDNAVPFGSSCMELLIDHLGNFNFPILFDFPAGHDKENIALKLGFGCTFDGTTFIQ